MAIKVTFLGTSASQGVPLIACKCGVCMSTNVQDKRLRPSVLIESAQARVIIDSGPDVRQQLLRENVDRLNGVVFTQEHRHHIIGLAEVLPFSDISQKPVQVFGTERVVKTLKREFADIFSDEKYPGASGIDLYIFEYETIVSGDLVIEPIDTYNKLPVKGFKIGKFAYVIDAELIPQEEKEKLRNLDVLVLSALHNRGDMLSGSVALAKELKPKKAYFTCIPHQLGLHNEVNKKLPPDMELAFDGLQLKI